MVKFFKFYDEKLTLIVYKFVNYKIYNIKKGWIQVLKFFAIELELSYKKFSKQSQISEKLQLYHILVLIREKHFTLFANQDSMTPFARRFSNVWQASPNELAVLFNRVAIPKISLAILPIRWMPGPTTDLYNTPS